MATERACWDTNPDECIRLAEARAAFAARALLEEFPATKPIAETVAGDVGRETGGRLRLWRTDPHRFLNEGDTARWAIDFARGRAVTESLVCRPVRTVLAELIGPDSTAIQREDYRILQFCYQDHMLLDTIGRTLNYEPGDDFLDRTRRRVREAYLRWQQRLRAHYGPSESGREFPLPVALR